MPTSILPPVRPFQGVRGIDAWGSGLFMAPRTRNGEPYGHKGLDFLGVVGDFGQFPIEGIVTLLGVAYPDDPATPGHETDLRSIHIEGVNAWDGMMIKVLYMAPKVTEGYHGQPGELLGAVQDRAGFATMAAAVHPDLPRGPMDNHIHMELYIKEGGLWVLKNPAEFLDVS